MKTRTLFQRQTCTANIFNVILTRFTGVPLSTVIPLYCCCPSTFFTGVPVSTVTSLYIYLQCRHGYLQINIRGYIFHLSMVTFIHRVKNPFRFRIFAILCKLLLILFFLAHGQTKARHTESYPVANTRRFSNARKIQCSVIVKVS